MKTTGNHWVVRFVTGEYGNRYKTKKEAIAYANACNSYSERHSGERVANAVEQYADWELVRRVEI